jgi:hypothetical protein
MKFRRLAFGPYYQDMPSWYILGNLSDVKKIGINEYHSKAFIPLKNAEY